MSATFEDFLDRSNLTGRQFLIYAGQRLHPGLVLYNSRSGARARADYSDIDADRIERALIPLRSALVGRHKLALHRLMPKDEAYARPVRCIVVITKHATVASHEAVTIISKAVRERDRDHLRFVAAQPCLVCGRTSSDPHHIRFAEQRAMGRKVSDRFSVPICRLHHRELHRRGNERAWWQKQGIDPWRRGNPLAQNACGRADCGGDGGR